VERRPHPQARYLSYGDIRAAADGLVRKHCGEIRVPVAIELLIEYHLDIPILPVPHLNAKLGIEGYLSRRGIAVDESAWKSNSNRYRFTLAHELGHYTLHSELLSLDTYRTPQEFLRFYHSLPDETLRKYEWQAHQFASFLLLPEGPLAELVTSGIAALESEGRALDLLCLTDCELLAKWIARQARVSRDVVMQRATQDGHWIPFR
jgi:hypothetical protein